MKIKLLKDLPKHKTGSIHENDSLVYGFQMLIDTGFAEEIKDDIDIEAIRRECRFRSQDIEMWTQQKFPEFEWFNAYRIVKAVIDQLNGDWKSVWNQNVRNYSIIYSHQSEGKGFSFEYWEDDQQSILPHCKDVQTAKKVIELCEKELKVLFGVK